MGCKSCLHASSLTRKKIATRGTEGGTGPWWSCWVTGLALSLEGHQQSPGFLLWVSEMGE